MKKIFVFIVLFCTALIVKAQDVIVLNNAEEIEAKVLSVTPDEITYKNWSNMDGPQYTIRRRDVFYIKYANGSKDVFVKERATFSNGINYNKSGSLKFQSYINAGAIFCKGAGGPSFDCNVGVRFYDYAYIGFETGVNDMISYILIENRKYRYNDMYIPLAANLKFYIPTAKDYIYPYINSSLGGFIGLADFKGNRGFYCQVGLGIDIKRVSIGAGYNGLVKYGTASMGYLKIGVRLGKL